MNILIVHNYYQQRGGEDAVFETEKEELKKIGHNIIEYTRHNKEIENYSLIQKIKFLYKTIYNNHTIKDLDIIIKKNKIEIAHIHNVFPLISPAIYKFLKKNNIKIVQTLHNYRFICPNGLFYKNENCQLCMNKSILNCIINKCYRNSLIYSLLYSLVIKLNQNNFKKNIDGYIALTDFTKNIFIKAGYNKDKFHIKDNGIPDKNIKRKKSKDYFLFLGRISNEKGIDFLLETFSKLDKYKLKIAGTCPELNQYKKKYTNKNIQFLGFVDGKTKYKLLQESQALIVPSIWFENYPISIVESFSIGIPVIASNIGGIPYIVEDRKSGLLFETNDFNSLKERLELINNNLKLREKLGNYSRKAFIKKMEIKNNIKILEKIYRDIINE